AVPGMAAVCAAVRRRHRIPRVPGRAGIPRLARVRPAAAERRPVDVQLRFRRDAREGDRHLLTAQPPCGGCRMLTARATTITASARLIADWTSISIFAQRLSGIVSVGLKAAAFVNET